MSNKYEKLKNLLKELFQLDQPDLDFGLYRIMHARSAEITKFLDQDLLPQVKASFAAYQPADKAAIQAELEKAVAQAQALGADPETLPKVKALRAKLAHEAVDIETLESEVYDHLYSFFRRYYSEGDFISKRVYKEGVYAIPYEGEEVKLYWANADQYYIKTSEYLRDYAFRLNPGNEADPKRVHFRLVDATEGEHGNVKEAEGKNRVFVLAGGREDVTTKNTEITKKEEELSWISFENNELVIKFEYRPATLTDWPEDQRAGKTKPPEQKELITIAEKRIQELATKNTESTKEFREWIDLLLRRHIKADGEAADYSRLVAHLNRYTARNTFDYFIHKDLGTFLNRELDFYIKNEVMHLDDVESETAPRVEQYLSKIKVIRKIAKKIIDFLAQLEDFQKKLWLKKKFVVETNYCITLDRVPEEFYPEIAANKAQVEEWVKLGFLENDSRGDAESAGKEKDLFGNATDGKLYASDVSVEFLKANDKLVLDTRFFSEDFKARLISSIEDFDEQMDGLLIHSENFQALNLLQARYREQVKCVYIDPPYNTEQDRQQGKFIYKDNFESSSWIDLMLDRIFESKNLLKKDGTFFSSIDHNEIANLKFILENAFTRENFEGLITWRRRHNQPNDKTKMIGMVSEYILCYAKNSILYKNNGVGKLDLTADFTNPDNDPKGEWASKPWKVGSDQGGSRYKIVTPTGKILEEEWMGDESTYKKFLAEGRIYFPKGGDGTPRKKYYKFEREEEGQCATNWWSHEQFGHNQGANDQLTSIFNQKNVFSNPKPIELVQGILQIANTNKNIILDYFAGSGTTGHAVINLNREDQGKRKYILVEMGDYFDTVLKPRIQKVIYSSEWKDGKPIASTKKENQLTTEFTKSTEKEKEDGNPDSSLRSLCSLWPNSSFGGISHCFKYIRLESYEDTLNNLDLRRTEAQTNLFDSNGEGADQFREDYILRYMLNVESRGSASLLNIDAFTDPTAYTLKVKIPGSDESREVKVDLLETFNYLLGLQVKNISAPHVISAEFERDSEKRLRIKGRLRELTTEITKSTEKEKKDGNTNSSLRSLWPKSWWFRTVTGTTLDGRKILVIWRKRPGLENPEGLEQDNLVLDTWFTKMGYSSRDSEFDTIYVNGTNNLENLKTPDDLWKVRLIEEDFKRLMFEDTGV